jgi:hypothetical protein
MPVLNVVCCLSYMELKMQPACYIQIHDDNGCHTIPIDLDSPKEMHGELWCEMYDAIGEDVHGWLIIDGKEIFEMTRPNGFIIQEGMN